MVEPIVPEPRSRRGRLWVALGITAVAVPLLVIDNLPEDPPPDPLAEVLPVAPEAVPAVRDATGPAKGVSVVTSSTTSSTVITTTTTTIPGS